jgi:putative nucleotidyltransferase with HDIG domain
MSDGKTPAAGTEDVRLADVLAALSIVTDLAMGQEPEKSVRAAILAVELARRLDLPDADVRDVYYATLMKHLGCTATAHEEAALHGPDERGTRAVAERTDETELSELLSYLAVAGRGAGAARVGSVLRLLTSGSRVFDAIFRTICEVGARFAERLDLGDGVVQALGESTERWDGRGAPRKLSGDELSIAARIAEPATQAVIFHRLGGPDAVIAMADRRAGGMFDPVVGQALREIGPAVLARMDADDPWETVLAAEPPPARTIPSGRIGTVAEVFGDLVDVQSVYTLGHSSGVALLAAAAAERVGLDVETVRIAGLLHDIGRTSVAAGTWERRGPLSSTDREQVRLHAYHSERILERSVTLSPFARIAGTHHERSDGSGYHRGSRAAELSPETRLLAVADAFQAMTQARPHRPAMPPEEAARVVGDEVAAGRFDPECARAVLEAAGTPPRRVRDPRPAGLSEREIEVLRLVSRGLSNKAIADALVISTRTAEHHVQHIYAKIGASTRAAAAMFAVEQGLLH